MPLDTNQDEHIWAATHAARTQLADVLETLTGDAWSTPSLCAGWTVQDVAAHVIGGSQIDLLRFSKAMLQARGSMHRALFLYTKQIGARPPAKIIDDYRRLAGARKRPPTTRVVDPLIDVIVHTQDIVRPLGISLSPDPRAVRLAADGVVSGPGLYDAQPRLVEHTFVATDQDWSAGAGPAVRGPLLELLLLLLGRPASEELLTRET